MREKGGGTGYLKNYSDRGRVSLISRKIKVCELTPIQQTTFEK